MSTPKDEIIYNVLRAMRRVASLSVKQEVEKWLNFEYFDLCRKHSWHGLRRKTTLDFSAMDSTDESGIWLPSNLFGIDRVRDTSTDTEFVRRDHADAMEPDSDGYRFYTHMPNDVSVFFAEDLTLQEDSTLITCPSLGTADYTGYYAQFGTEPGFYKLTTATQFSPTYRGPQLINQAINIRPPTTEKMVILDQSENILRDREVDVYYWQAPQPLYKPSDMCILPLSTPLELRLAIRCLGFVGKRELSADRYRGEYNEAIAEALRLNPDFPRKARPRDVHNRIFDMQQVYHSQRTSGSNGYSGDLRYMFQRSE